MRRYAMAVTVTLGLWAPSAQAAEARHPTLELRISPPLLRPFDVPSLGALVAFPTAGRWWVGGGYELIQDYDAIVWTAEREGHTPVVMSAIRAGAWYRVQGAWHGTTLAVGALASLASPYLSFVTRPDGLASGTYVVDLGADLSAGYAGNGYRFEVFGTPAWSIGRVPSPAVSRQETYDGFTYRIGVALAIFIGS